MRRGFEGGKDCGFFPACLKSKRPGIGRPADRFSTGLGPDVQSHRQEEVETRGENTDQEGNEKRVPHMQYTGHMRQGSSDLRFLPAV